jgi:FGGY-family pentulose kinase
MTQASSEEGEAMAEGPYLLGIDFGTGGCRAGIFDRKGEPVAFEAVEFSTTHPRPAWAEQDPDQWESALIGSVKGALEKSGVSAEEIAGIGTDSTAATVVAMDENGRHLRPAILWMDVRASDQARRIQETGDPALKYNGFGAVSAEWGLPKAMWLKEKEPETFQKARYISDCADWVTKKLTGEWTTSINTAAAKYYHDRDVGGFPESLYNALDAGDILDKYPGEVTDLGVVVGGLVPEIAEATGLKAGTPVAEGGIDAYMGAIGLGVTEPGKIALITGSSHVMIGQAPQAVHGQGFWGSYTDAMIPGQYTVEAGQVSTGSVVNWFKTNFAGDAAAEAKRRGVDVYDVLTEQALQVPVGSEGLIVLEYFQGNRTPHTDPLARGVITGLSLSHGPGHLFRAIIEGICYGTEDIFRTMRAHDFEPRINVVSGGPAKSELWMQLHADVSNVPIGFTKVSEGPVLGSAMLGAIAAGIYPDIPTAGREMVQTERVLEPNEARHEEYKFWVDRYIETYPATKDVQHKAVRHVMESGDARAREAVEA